MPSLLFMIGMRIHKGQASLVGGIVLDRQGTVVGTGGADSRPGPDRQNVRMRSFSDDLRFAASACSVMHNLGAGEQNQLAYLILPRRDHSGSCWYAYRAKLGGTERKHKKEKEINI